MKKARFLFKILFPSLLIVYLSAYLFVSLFFPEKKMDIFGYQIAIVQTGSMEPEIKVRDGVFIVKASPDKLKVGDVINFWARVKTENGDLVELSIIHYLGDVSEDRSAFKTQSYARRMEGTFDFWYDDEGNRIEAVGRDDIIGKVAFRIPYLGYIVEGFREPLLLLLGALNALLVILLIVIIKDTKKKEDGKAEPEK